MFFIILLQHLVLGAVLPNDPRSYLYRCAKSQLDSVEQELTSFSSINQTSSWKSHIMFVSLGVRGHFSQLEAIASALAETGKYLISFAGGSFLKEWLITHKAHKNIIPLPGGTDTLYTAGNCGGASESNLSKRYKILYDPILCAAQGDSSNQIVNQIRELLRMDYDSLNLVADTIVGFNQAVLNATIGGLKQKPDLMVIDQQCFGAFTVAQFYSIRSISLQPQLLGGNGVFPTKMMPSFIPYYGLQSETSYFGFVIQPIFKAYAFLRDFYGGWKASRYRKAIGMPSIYSFGNSISTSVVFVTTAFGFDYPRPLPSNVHLVGQLTLTKPLFDLPQELSTFLDQSDKPCYVLSLGSTIVNPVFMRWVTTVFNDLCGLWSLPETQHVMLPENIPKGLYISPFLPQRELLKHPKLATLNIRKSWICESSDSLTALCDPELYNFAHYYLCHFSYCSRVVGLWSSCGLGSVQESILLGTPVLCTPFEGDQLDVAYEPSSQNYITALYGARVRESHVGEVSMASFHSSSCRHKHNTECSAHVKDLKLKIQKIANHSNYKIGLDRTAQLLQFPKDTAEKLIDHILLHGDSHFFSYDTRHGWLWASSHEFIFLLLAALTVAFFAFVYTKLVASFQKICRTLSTTCQQKKKKLLELFEDEKSEEEKKEISQNQELENKKNLARQHFKQLAAELQILKGMLRVPDEKNPSEEAQAILGQIRALGELSANVGEFIENPSKEALHGLDLKAGMMSEGIKVGAVGKQAEKAEARENPERKKAEKEVRKKKLKKKPSGKQSDTE